MPPYNFPATAGLSQKTEHAIIGLVTEAGELMDQVKKIKIYGRDPDRANLIEEAGDLMWYMAVLADSLDISFEEIWEKNIAKLASRYPDKFNAEDEANRDLENERKIFI